MTAFEHQYTQEQIDDALAMLIAMAGNVRAARRELKAAGKKTPTDDTLAKWARITHWERYEELRERYAAKIEGKLSNDMLDASRRATEGAMLATEAAIERVKAGEDEDPGRTAANLSTVGAKMTDKRLSLQGRPTSIHENRDATEILRGLLAKHPHIFSLTDEPEQGALPEETD